MGENSLTERKIKGKFLTSNNVLIAGSTSVTDFTQSLYQHCMIFSSVWALLQFPDSRASLDSLWRPRNAAAPTKPLRALRLRDLCRHTDSTGDADVFRLVANRQSRVPGFALPWQCCLCEASRSVTGIRVPEP